MNALKIPPVPGYVPAADSVLRQILEQDMGFDLSRTDLVELVVQLKRDGKGYGSFDDFVSAVASKIAVHETYFLRHHDQFDWIEKTWLPTVIAAQSLQADKVIRILSAGCSTGEEPYSLYAHLQPLLSMLGYRLEVDAVDISEPTLEIARKGRYGLWSLRGVNSAQEKSWLEVQSRNVMVREWVREGVNFSRHNLTKPFPPECFQKYDLVLCRNVMIYMHQSAIHAIYNHLTAVLKPGAFLIPGPSDPVPVSSDRLALEWQSGVRLYRKTPDQNDIPQAAQTGIAQALADDAAFIEAFRPLQADVTEPQVPSPKPYTALDHIEALLRQCEYNQARQLLEQNIEHDPLDVKSLVMLAMLAMDLNDIDLAASVIRKAMYLKPKSPYVIYLSANIRYYRKDVPGALKHLRWALDELNECHPDDEVEFFDGMKVEQLKGVIHARLAAMSR